MEFVTNTKYNANIIIMIPKYTTTTNIVITIHCIHKYDNLERIDSQDGGLFFMPAAAATSSASISFSPREYLKNS